MRIKISLLLAILVGVLVITASANDSVCVLANGQKCAFDQPPVIINNRTMVPCRSIFEKLGAKVSWDPANQQINVKNGTDTVSLNINNDVMKVNNTNVKLDCAPQIINGRTLVPVRAISEALDCNVSWNNNTKTVAINNKPTSNCPAGNCNTGNCKTGTCPTGNYKTSACPTGNSKIGTCPTGNCKTSACPTGNCKTSACPTGNCKTSTSPTGNCKTGSCPTGNSNINNILTKLQYK